jgi:hypothetical protein
LAIPAICFFDDTKLTELAGCHCFESFSDLLSEFGWVFDPEQDTRPKQVGTFLGNIEALAKAHVTGSVTLKPRAEVETLIGSTRRCIQTFCLHMRLGHCAESSYT